MTKSQSELAATLAEYRTGLEEEVKVLAKLKQLSGDQHATGTARSVLELTAINAERDRVMNALMSVEERLKPLRQVLTTHRSEISGLEGYEDTIALHRQAEALVAEIVDGNQQTLAAFENVENTRRLAHEMIEKGRASLSAYRRVILPESLPTVLFNRKS